MSKYRVEVLFWTRTYDGDDWTTGEHTFSYDCIGEAVKKASNPFSNTKGLIESKIYNNEESRYTAIWTKNWEENKITDYTTLPDVEYHNREYDNGKD